MDTLPGRVPGRDDLTGRPPSDAAAGAEPGLDDIHASALRAIPLLRNMLLSPTPSAHVETEPFPGTLLLDRDWLAQRIADAGQLWGCDDRRVVTTPWWYSASSTLVAIGAAALLVTGRAPDPRPETLKITLRRSSGYVGYLARTRSDRRLPGFANEYGQALRDGLAPVMAALADLGGANPRSLWSILADSLAGRLLAVAEKVGGHDVSDLLGFAAQVRDDDARLPRLRYTTAQTADSQVRYVRRGSCCLFYRLPERDKCENCPRQSPAQRSARVIAAHTDP